ncbi:MAG TPA: hypothetical protein VIK14_14805 [Ignavibacteria bacterium]|jgi:hypothetical protein
MNFSKFQKELICLINIGKIKDSISFYDKYQKEDIDDKTDIVQVKDLHQKIIDYIILINKLSENGLIYVTNVKSINSLKKGRSANTNTKDERGVLIKEIYEFINVNKFDEIYPTEELIKFEKRGYKTQEDKNRIWLKWIPLGVAVLTVILSSLFNFLIYNNQRKVIIENSGAFKDTIKVIVIDTVKKIDKTDTLKTKDNK